jgi:hypothetical protein
MGYTGKSTGVSHSIQKFTLVRARVFSRQFYFDVECSTVADPVPPDISLAVVPDVYDGAVLGVELPHRMISGYAAMLTQSCDNLIL